MLSNIIIFSFSVAAIDYGFVVYSISQLDFSLHLPNNMTQIVGQMLFLTRPNIDV